MSIPMGNRPLLSLGVLLIIVGAQFFCFGLVAEVLARTYYESQDKAIYAVRRVVVGGQEDADIIPLVNGQRQWNRRALN
jgi:hypothetical protein